MPPQDPERKRIADKAYRESHKEEIAAYKRQWIMDHKEEVILKKRLYYEANKEEITAKQKAYQKAYREANPEKVRTANNEKTKRHYQKNRETILARIRPKHAAYRAANPEKLQAYRDTHKDQAHKANVEYYAAHRAERNKDNKQWRLEHSEERKVYSAHYRASHPDLLLDHARRRRARKANAPINDFTHAQWVEMQEAYAHRCVYCGKRAKGHLTQDHILALSKGGPHTASNIIPACRTCNNKKFTGPPLVPVQPLLFTLAPAKKTRKD